MIPFDNYAVNGLLFLITLVNILMFIYSVKQKTKNFFFVILSFCFYILSSVIVNLLYVFQYINKIGGYVFYIAFQLNMFALILGTLYRNKKFVNWYNKLLKI